MTRARYRPALRMTRRRHALGGKNRSPDRSGLRLTVGGNPLAATRGENLYRLSCSVKHDTTTAREVAIPASCTAHTVVRLGVTCETCATEIAHAYADSCASSPSCSPLPKGEGDRG